ncbi:MAG TPA: metallophosphoesterase [Candidatus Paceibacterota bacterium]|nr:metallophosphoesterase [Candidatus Paceibacterota bacterium]
MPVAIVANFIVFELLLIIVHLAVYATLAAAFGIGSVWLKSLFILLALTFVSASALAHFYKGAVMDWYYRFSAYWFGLVHFLFAAAVIFYFTLTILYARGIYVSPALVGSICFGVFFLIHLYATWKSQHPEVTNITIPFSIIPGFRADFWKGKKIVFVADFQLGNIYRKHFVARVAKKIAAVDPYAVLIGGDLYDGVVCDEAALIEPLRALHPAGGVYYITGNHEYYLRDVSSALAVVRAAGITVLDDKKIDIGGIDFIGVDYRSSHKREDFKKTLDRIGVDHAKPSVLLKHEPKDLDVAAAAGVSLDLSGHTHHGQIFPLMFFTWQIYEGFDYGLKRLGAMQVFTSSGVGTWGPPLRLGTKSEIVVIEFV